ncbi:MAG TPA: tetratricopeptide repeat protein [Oligoflexia bacterium]|nr:tetratricopeptide repeat protein [Oligoflexia bacterium]HMP48798.1 tetratricopeptide repeat protein [Oligoflexia bacterium]
MKQQRSKHKMANCPVSRSEVVEFWVYVFIIVLLCSSACSVSGKAPPGVYDRAQARQFVSKGVGYLREYDSGKASALDQASASFDLALGLDNESPEVYDGKGCVLWRRGDIAGAEFLFNRALEVDPKYARAWVHLAYLQERQGNIDIAKEYLRRAIMLDNFDPHALNNLGGITFDHSNDSFEREWASSLIHQARELAGPESMVIKKNIGIIKRR